MKAWAALFGLAAALAAGWLAPRLAAPADRFGVAMTLMQAGRGGEAALLLADPMWRGVAEFRAGRYRRAETAFAAGEDAPALYNLGTARAKLHDYAGARAAYQAALRIDPGHADAAFNLDLVDQAQAAAQRLAEAERLARRLGDAAPGAPERDAEGSGEGEGAGERAAGDPAQSDGEPGQEVAADQSQSLGESQAAETAPSDQTLAARGDLADDAAAGQTQADAQGAASILRESAAEAEALLRLIRDDPKRVLRARLNAIHRMREAAK